MQFDSFEPRSVFCRHPVKFIFSTPRWRRMPDTIMKKFNIYTNCKTRENFWYYSLSLVIALPDLLELPFCCISLDSLTVKFTQYLVYFDREDRVRFLFLNFCFWQHSTMRGWRRRPHWLTGLISSVVVRTLLGVIFITILISTKSLVLVQRFVLSCETYTRTRWS